MDFKLKYIAHTLGVGGEGDDAMFVAKFDVYLKILLSGTCIYG